MNTDPKKVIGLVEQMTRAEIMARLGPLGGGIEWYSIYLNKKDKLQQYLFGSSDYVELGLRWGLLKQYKSKNKIISDAVDDMLGEL